MSEDILESAKIEYPKTEPTTGETAQQEAAARAKRSASKVFTPEEAIAKCKELEDGDIIPALRRCIEKLLRELTEARAELSTGEITILQHDNRELKAKLAAIQEALTK